MEIATISRVPWLRICAIVITALFGGTSYATNGYFSHGYGIQYKALAGAGVALHLGPMAAATNPAGMAFAGNRYDVSVSVFNPNREYTVTGAPSMLPGTFGLAPGTIKSDSKVFFIPSLAASWALDENSSVGVSIFGNGGMSTDYAAPTFGFKPTGVNLIQLFVAPTFAYKVHKHHAFGVTPIVAYQRFEANGLAAFGPFSSAPTKLSNNSTAGAIGFGARIGYSGQLMDFLTIGAALQTKAGMGELKDYAGLFAEQGDFDIPLNWTVGVALGFEQMGLVFDVQQILYSGVKSVGNPLKPLELAPAFPDGRGGFIPNPNFKPLGSDGGAGFGWKDMTIFKGGVYYETDGGWMLRAGYSFGTQPIPTSEVLFNILAPGVIEQHLTFGFSKSVGEEHEISFVATRAFSKSVRGPNPLEVPGQQFIELKMDQWEFGVGFSF